MANSSFYGTSTDTGVYTPADPVPAVNAPPSAKSNSSFYAEGDFYQEADPAVSEDAATRAKASADAAAASSASADWLSGAGTVTPVVDGTAAVGTATKWAHEDHVHPTDTSRASINQASAMTGFRNKIINGDFAIWQRGASFTNSSVYTADRWQLQYDAGEANFVTKGVNPGNAQTDTYMSWNRAAAGGSYSLLLQPMEGVKTLNGRTVTVTFWAFCQSTTQLTVDLMQSFGTGGSPSSNVFVTPQTINLGVASTKYSLTFSIPSTAGQTLGTNNNDALILRFIRYSSNPNPVQLIGIAHVSVVDGDATAEADPFSPRHIQQELALCQRYFTLYGINIRGYNIATGTSESYTTFPATMRAAPTLAVVTAGTPILNCTLQVPAITDAKGVRMGAQITADGVFYYLNGVGSAAAEL